MEFKVLEVLENFSVRQPISMAFSSQVKSKPVIKDFSFDRIGSILNVSFATDIPSYLINNLRYEFWIEPIYKYTDMKPTSEPVAGFLWCKLDNAHLTIDQKGLLKVEAKLPINILLSQHKFYLVVLAPSIHIKLTTYVHYLMLRKKHKLELKQRLLSCWRRKYNYVECACIIEETYKRRLQSESLLLSRRLFLNEENKAVATPIILAETNCIYIFEQSIVENISLKTKNIKLNHIVSLLYDEKGQPLLLNNIGLSNQIAFSYDDQFIAVAGQYGKIYLIDLLMLAVTYTIHLDIQPDNQISAIVMHEHWLYIAQKGHQAPLVRINICNYGVSDALRVQNIPLPVSNYGYDSLEIDCGYLVIASAFAKGIDNCIYAFNLDSLDYRDGNLKQGFSYVNINEAFGRENILRITKTCNYTKFILTRSMYESLAVVNLVFDEDDNVISLVIDKTIDIEHKDTTVLTNKYIDKYNNLTISVRAYFDFGAVLYAFLASFQQGGAVLTIIKDVFESPTTLGETQPIDGLLIKYLTIAQGSNGYMVLYAITEDINNQQYCVLVWNLDELILSVNNSEVTINQSKMSNDLQPQKIELINNHIFGEFYAICAKPSVIRLINLDAEDPFSHDVVFGGKGGEKTPDYRTHLYGLVNFHDTHEEKEIVMDGDY